MYSKFFADMSNLHNYQKRETFNLIVSNRKEDTCECALHSISFVYLVNLFSWNFGSVDQTNNYT